MNKNIKKNMDYTKERHLRVFEAFAGYGSRLLALRRLERDFPGQIKVVPVGFSEIDPSAIKAYKALHGDVRNYGDISKIDWCTAAYNLGYNGGFERRGKKNRKVVCQIDMNGLLIRKFSSATEAAKEVKGFVTNNSAVCLGRMKSYRGYGWRYE